MQVLQRAGKHWSSLINTYQGCQGWGGFAHYHGFHKHGYGVLLGTGHDVRRRRDQQSQQATFTDTRLPSKQSFAVDLDYSW